MTGNADIAPVCRLLLLLLLLLMLALMVCCLQLTVTMSFGGHNEASELDRFQ